MLRASRKPLWDTDAKIPLRHDPRVCRCVAHRPGAFIFYTDPGLSSSNPRLIYRTLKRGPVLVMVLMRLLYRYSRSATCARSWGWCKCMIKSLASRNKLTASTPSRTQRRMPWNPSSLYLSIAPVFRPLPWAHPSLQHFPYKIILQLLHRHLEHLHLFPTIQRPTIIHA